MKKFFFYFLFLFSPYFFSQENTTDFRFGIFQKISAHIGIDAHYFIDKEHSSIDFNYGFSAEVGFHPFKRWAISGGLRYDYITPNLHPIYAFIKPHFLLNNPSEERDYSFVNLKYGQKINHINTPEAQVLGIGLGFFEVVKKGMGHQFEIFVDFHSLSHDTPWFVGFSYGIFLFGNKNLN